MNRFQFSVILRQFTFGTDSHHCIILSLDLKHYLHSLNVLPPTPDDGPSMSLFLINSHGLTGKLNLLTAFFITAYFIMALFIEIFFFTDLFINTFLTLH